MFRTACRLALLGTLIVLGGAAAPATVSARAAGPSAVAPVAQVNALYRKVLTAEYFGPASTFCSNLTAGGVRAFTAGGSPNCTAAFKTQQHILRHKTKGVDDSGYTPKQWRGEVSYVVAHLMVTVHGSDASAIGPSGIPGRTTLVKVDGQWKFSSYPPSIQP